MIACCYFLLLRCSAELLLEAFSAMEGFSGRDFRMGFVPDYEGNAMEVMVWLIMAWINWMEAEKRDA